MQLVKPLAAFALAISTGLALTLGLLSPSVRAQSSATQSPATLGASLAGDTVSQAAAELSAPPASVESLPAPLPEAPPRIRPQQPAKPGSSEPRSSSGHGVLSASDEALLFPTVPEAASEPASDANAPQPGPLDIGSSKREPDNLSPVVPASAAELVAKPSEDQDAPKPRETNNSTQQPNEALPGIENAPAFPRGAAAIGYRGNATMLVLPGGRIVLAPAGIVPAPLPVGQRPAVFAPPTWSPPLPPPLRSGFRNRLGRR